MNSVRYATIEDGRLPVAKTRTPGKRRPHRKKPEDKPWPGVLFALAVMTALSVITAVGMLSRTEANAAEPEAAVMTESVGPAYATAEPVTVSVEILEPPCPWTRYEAEELAKAIWGEARGCKPAHQAAVAWCALNRVDAPQWSGDLVSVLAQPCQFCGYDPEYPIDPDILAIAEDVLARYYSEKETGMRDPGRVLPENYYYFTGDGVLNYFRTEYEDTGAYWDWSLPSPYGD